jgi:heme/copper-type cytochrome/quinol oxidase subunit 2
LAEKLMPELFFPAAAVALVAQSAVLWSVIAGRAPASTPGRSARMAEIAWVVLPTVVLIAILLLTWNRMGEPIALAPLAGVRA